MGQVGRQGCPLNRTQKRLLWVLRTYGEREPLTAIYTWMVARNFSSAPWDVISIWSIFENVVNFASWPGGPSPQVSVGGMLRHTVANMQVRTEEGDWRDTPCAKMFPALARWISAALKSQGWVSRFSNDQVLAEPWTRAKWLASAPSPAFLDWLRDVSRRFQMLCDWFVAASPELGNYATWEEALAASERWHEGIAIESVIATPGPIWFKWPDGWTVQQLVSWEMFRQEGGALGHCIGLERQYWHAYERGDAVYLSLRRPDGAPWMTFEAVPPSARDGAKAAQIKGCKNRLPGTHARSRECPRPDPTECVRVWQFLDATTWLVGPDYAACWGFTAASIGLPRQVQERSPASFPASELVRPPSPMPVPEGKATKLLDRKWFMKSYPQRRR